MIYHYNYYGLNVCAHPNSYVKALTPRVNIFEKRAGKKVIKAIGV